MPEFMEDRTRIYQQHLTRYVFALAYARKRKVLDAACGVGYGTDLIANVANDVLGVDNSKEAIEYARRRYRGRFQVVDLDKEFPNEDFDVVISFETIEHLGNPDFFLENVKKRSKLFVFSIPIGVRISRFHKRTYSIEDVVELTKNHFQDFRWFSQRGNKIDKGLQSCNYLIGSVRI